MTSGGLCRPRREPGSLPRSLFPAVFPELHLGLHQSYLSNPSLMSAPLGFRVFYCKQRRSERLRHASWNRRERAGLGHILDVGWPGHTGAPGMGLGARSPSGKVAPVSMGRDQSSRVCSGFRGVGLGSS